MNSREWQRTLCEALGLDYTKVKSIRLDILGESPYLGVSVDMIVRDGDIFTGLIENYHFELVSKK
jgi:hypothetical protein